MEQQNHGVEMNGGGEQGAVDIEERKEIEIRVMQIKIKRHAQNKQTIAIPTKICMQSTLSL